MPNGNEPSAVEQLFQPLDVLSIVYRLIFLFFVIGFQPVFGQLPPGVIDRLSAQAVRNKVQIEVTLSAGYTCNGIIITRSTDSLQFETIGLIGGVCGDSAASVSYSFTDSFPPTNQRLFYQLLLGGRIATDTRQVVVYDFTERPLILAPNPASNWVEVRFEAAVGTSEQLIMRNASGNMVQSIESEDGFARFDLRHLPAGTYYINLRSGAGRTEKLILTR